MGGGDGRWSVTDVGHSRRAAPGGERRQGGGGRRRARGRRGKEGKKKRSDPRVARTPWTFVVRSHLCRRATRLASARRAAAAARPQAAAAPAVTVPRAAERGATSVERRCQSGAAKYPPAPPPPPRQKPPHFPERVLSPPPLPAHDPLQRATARGEPKTYEHAVSSPTVLVLTRYRGSPFLAMGEGGGGFKQDGWQYAIVRPPLGDDRVPLWGHRGRLVVASASRAPRGRQRVAGERHSPRGAASAASAGPTWAAAATASATAADPWWMFGGSGEGCGIMGGTTGWRLPPLPLPSRELRLGRKGGSPPGGRGTRGQVFSSDGPTA